MEDLQSRLPMLLYATLDAIMPAIRRHLARYGLTEQQWRVLSVLWAEDRRCQNDIADKSLIPKQSLVGVIDRLESLDLLYRTPSETDRRKSQICLTSKGKALERYINPGIDALFQEMEARLAEEEWQELRRMLGRVAQR